MLPNMKKLYNRPWRWAKAIFFLTSMLASLFFVCAPQLLVILLDLLLPSVILAAIDSRPQALCIQLRSYHFETSLIDLPVLSATRSILLLCFYLCWNGRGPYLGMSTLCAGVSAGYVSIKAISMFGAEVVTGKWKLGWLGKESPAVEAMFLSSLALAMAHVVAAYRTSCRERRKLLVYKIDIESVSAYSNGFSNYRKIALIS